MKIENYREVVAIKEKAAGNQSVGTVWLQTKTFDKGDTIEEVMKWADDSNGKILLTINEGSHVDETL